MYEVNKEQQSYIEYLDYYVTFYKKAFLGYLNFTIEYLEERQEEASRKLDLLEGFVKDRKCEYFSVSVSVWGRRRGGGGGEGEGRRGLIGFGWMDGRVDE